jgi:hypothetical protein
MQNIVCTLNEWHLGDNLIHLNYLYRLSRLNPEKQFRHYVNSLQLGQLRPLIEGIPNIELFELQLAPSWATNCWIGPTPRNLKKVQQYIQDKKTS